MTGKTFTLRLCLISIIGLMLIFSGSIANAFPEVVDLEDSRDFITDGYNILVLDDLSIWDNLVLEDGADYPFGTVWLILYDPDPYADMDEMFENKWNRSRELARYQVPGPRSQDRWGAGDEIVFRNAGVYDWASNSFDRVVFRFIVEDPSAELDTDTIMWGTVYEVDTYSSSDFTNDYADTTFRTTDLPEYESPPYVTFNELWFEHEVIVDGRDGVMLHVDFQIDNMRGLIGRLAAYVHYDEDDEPVECMIDEPDYMTSDGYLTNQLDYMPPYPNTIYSDSTFFFPYEAFPSGNDYLEYYVHVEYLDEDWNYVGGMDSPVFEVYIPK